MLKHFYVYREFAVRIPLTSVRLFVSFEVMPIAHLGVGAEVGLRHGVLSVDLPLLFLSTGWNAEPFPFEVKG